MFVDPSDSKSSSIDGTGQQTGLYPISRTTSCWIWLSVSITCNLLCLILNVIFSIVSIRERHHTFKSSFYAIVIAFSMSVIVSSTCKLAYDFIAGLAGVQSKGFGSFSITIDLAISYFAALLLFLMGFNRFAAFSSPYLYDRLMKSRTLGCILIGLLVFSTVITLVIYKISGLGRSFDENAMNDYASDRISVQVSNYIFHALPIVSSVFYLLAYKSLRSKREDVVSQTTKTLLDKFERSMLNQGMWILIVYLISLTVRVTMLFPLVDGVSVLLLKSLGTITATAPQMALPLSVLLCSKEARNVTSRICWSSVKYRLTSMMNSRRGSSSSKAHPLTAQSLHI